MKTNEAPEKIYLDEDESWHLTNPNGDSVEYIRKDAFIEKAVEYILTHIPDMHILGDSCRMDECIIEDFKKHMVE